MRNKEKNDKVIWKRNSNIMRMIDMEKIEVVCDGTSSENKGERDQKI